MERENYAGFTSDTELCGRLDRSLMHAADSMGGLMPMVSVSWKVCTAMDLRDGTCGRITDLIHEHMYNMEVDDEEDG